MLLNREAHFARFASETYRNDCAAAGLAFLRGKRIPKNMLPEEMSVWMAHAVIRTAVYLGDERWRFAYCVAAAANRPYRDNERAERSTVAGVKPKLPHPATKLYAREFGVPPMTTHVVAVCAPMEVIDLAFWVWRDEDRGVRCPDLAWMRLNDTGTFDDKLPALTGADWLHYGIEPATEDLRNLRVAATAEAADAIDMALR